jgi:hypothetical protein
LSSEYLYYLHLADAGKHCEALFIFFGGKNIVAST